MPRMPRAKVWLTGLALVAAREAIAQPVSFQGLGSIGGWTNSDVYRLSADGTTVVGRAGQEAARWRRATGWQSLGVVGNGTTLALGASADGNVVAGSAGGTAFSWTPATGALGLSVGTGQASAVSADGSTIVGAGSTPTQQTRAFRIVHQGPVEFLGTLAGYEASSARAASSDGRTLAGWSFMLSAHFRAARWDASGAIEDLGVLPGTSESRAYDMSADGSIVVGHSFNPWSVNHAVRWTASGIDDLGSLEPDYLSSAFGVSADGRTVVGGSGNHAFLWTPALGMVDLQQHLLGLGANLAGWTLTEARSVSADGYTIAGNGRNPQGQSVGWIATIPDPPASVLLVIAAMRRTRRRPDGYAPSAWPRSFSTASS